MVRWIRLALLKNGQLLSHFSSFQTNAWPHYTHDRMARGIWKDPSLSHTPIVSPELQSKGIRRYRQWYVSWADLPFHACSMGIATQPLQAPPSTFLNKHISLFSHYGHPRLQEPNWDSTPSLFTISRIQEFAGKTLVGSNDLRLYRTILVVILNL